MNYKEYLKRIHYEDKSIDTDSSTLKKLCECQLKNVPFENFDMFGGKKRVLDQEKLYENIVVKKRGGFCYELNGLFCWLLRELGFQVDILRVKLPDVKFRITTYKTLDHMCLMVRAQYLS